MKNKKKTFLFGALNFKGGCLELFFFDFSVERVSFFVLFFVLFVVFFLSHSLCFFFVK